MLMVGIAGFATFAGNVAALWEILLPMGTFLAGWKIGNGLYELITGEDIDMTMWEQLDEIFGTLFNDSETFFVRQGDIIGRMCAFFSILLLLGVVVRARITRQE